MQKYCFDSIYCYAPFYQKGNTMKKPVQHFCQQSKASYMLLQLDRSMLVKWTESTQGVVAPPASNRLHGRELFWWVINYSVYFRI